MDNSQLCIVIAIMIITIIKYFPKYNKIENMKHLQLQTLYHRCGIIHTEHQIQKEKHKSRRDDTASLCFIVSVLIQFIKGQIIPINLSDIKYIHLHQDAPLKLRVVPLSLIPLLSHQRLPAPHQHSFDTHSDLF